MTHISPAAYLVWSFMSVLVVGFYFYHLWHYDRFKCLKWNNGPYSGAFRRLMTYTYLLALPLMAIYSVGNAIIKYNEGFIMFPEHGIIPMPWQLWRPAFRKAIFPLIMMQSFAWSMEMITHLEELCFWLFLINASSSQQDWFKSWYFKTWTIGSVIAVTYVPLITIFTRSDPLVNEAYTFLAGSLGSLSLTLWFFPILWIFPSFLKNLESQGGDEGTIVRLTTFNELNRVRVAFRLLFVVPFVILGGDGIRPHKHINESMFGTDFLAMVAAFGCCVSSALTLIIFFPRSITAEHRTRKAERAERAELEKQRQYDDGQTQDESPMFALTGTTSSLPVAKPTISLTYAEDYEDKITNAHELPPTYLEHMPAPKPWISGGYGNSRDSGDHSQMGRASLSSVVTVMPLRPNRRVEEEAAIENNSRQRSGASSSPFGSQRWVHPLLKNFRSPIELLSGRRN